MFMGNFLRFFKSCNFTPCSKYLHTHTLSKSRDISLKTSPFTDKVMRENRNNGNWLIS